MKTMTVYVIADIKVTDPGWVPAYAASVHDLVHKHGGTFPLSVYGVLEARRVAAWRDGIMRIVRLDVEALPDVCFQADLTIRILPGLGIISGQHSPFRVGRSRPLVADGNDDLVLLVR